MSSRHVWKLPECDELCKFSFCSSGLCSLQQAANISSGYIYSSELSVWQQTKINEMVSDLDDKQPFLTHRAAPERKMVLNSTVSCFVFLPITMLIWIWMSEGLIFSSTLCIWKYKMTDGHCYTILIVFIQTVFWVIKWSDVPAHPVKWWINDEVVKMRFAIEMWLKKNHR